ncbi:helix-turn-helix domain-containing protein [Streptomyces fulvoviolaceus]|uniref:helix-turn-helix domain-containing protein n=1 Tax=Streptomyces fulvoviolaceus TaxID=285535 RepID=UPI0004C83625|nr:helix-turn-helix transcriptional regulator [Streptomyces fulvoviolaceus]
MAVLEEQNETDSMLKFFGDELQRLRAEQGKSQQALADACFCNRTLVNKIENAKRVPSKNFALHADEFFQTGGHFERLWPLVIKYAYPSWFRPYVELEAQAAIIRAFDTMIIPGLLQTRAYAHAVLASGRSNDVDGLLDARMERQAILERETPPELWVVMEEYALRRKVADSQVMREQLQQLIDVSERPSTVIQVVPFSAGAHAGIAGPFHSLTFAEGNPVVYVDGFLKGQLLADPTEVKAAQRAYDLLMGTALDVQKSVDLIAEVMKEVAT